MSTTLLSKFDFMGLKQQQPKNWKKKDEEIN